MARERTADPIGQRLVRSLALLGLILALLWAVLVWGSVLPQLSSTARAGTVDFFTLLDSARVWRAGLDPYTVDRFIPDPDAPGGQRAAHPNLNHPAMVIAFVPLTLLSPAAAFSVWTVLSTLAYLAAAALARGIARPSDGAYGRAWWWLLIATAPGFLYDRQLGQVGGVLALVAVLAWAGLRRDTAVGRVGGAALAGLLVVFKPFFAPLALLTLAPARGRPRRMAAFLAGVVVPSLLVLPAFGVGGFAHWLGRSKDVTWYDHGFNASLTGLVARVGPAALPGWVPWAIAVVVWLLALPLLILPPPPGLARLDRDVGVLLAVALLGSPLGWLYYTPLLLPPFAALWAARPKLAAPTRRLGLAALILLWVPHSLLPIFPVAAWSQLTLRATTTYGLVLLIAALVVPAGRPLETKAIHAPGMAEGIS